MEQVEQPTSGIKCDSSAELAEARVNVELTGTMEGQASPQPDGDSAEILEDATWTGAQEGESVSPDCGGMSDPQEPGSGSGEEVESSEASDITGTEVSPGSKGSCGTNLQNGGGTEQEGSQPNSNVPVTTQNFQGKSSLDLKSS